MIGHHLLLIPALLLDRKIKLDEGSLLDFCTMINALTLHNRLITLPATLPDSLGDLQLYNYLTKESKGILYELDLSKERFDDQDKERISYLLFGRRVSDEENILSKEIDAVASGTIYYDEYSENLSEHEYSLVNPESKRRCTEPK